MTESLKRQRPKKHYAFIFIGVHFNAGALHHSPSARLCMYAVIIYSAPHLIRRPFADKLPVMERLLCVCVCALVLSRRDCFHREILWQRAPVSRAVGCSGAGKKRRWRTRERIASPTNQPAPRFFLLSERVICSNCRSFSRSLSYLLCESNAAHSSSLAPEQIVWKTKIIFFGEELHESSLLDLSLAETLLYHRRSFCFDSSLL